MVIQKSNKDNSFVVVNKTDYLDEMENHLNDKCKFEKITLKKGYVDDIFVLFISPECLEAF